MREEDLRRTRAGFGREMIYQERLEYWEVITFLVRLGFLFVFFAVETCGWEPCMADTDVAP